MTDARAVFIALIVLFTLTIGFFVFNVVTGGYVKPLVDRLAPDTNDAIGTVEYTRISDNLYTGNRIIWFIGLALPIVGAILYYFYSREESRFGV